MAREGTLYSVAVEHRTEDGWRQLVEPWYQAWGDTPDELAEQVAADYDLDDLGHPWTVGVFEGVRFDKLITERRGG